MYGMALLKIYHINNLATFYKIFKETIYMSRKKYIIIILLFTIPIIPICIYIDNTKFEHIGTILIRCLCSFVCFFTSYLLIYKKSYNILAGMTEEEYTRIEKIPKEKEKMEKISKRVGYIFAFIGILLLFTIYFILLKKTQFKFNCVFIL